MLTKEEVENVALLSRIGLTEEDIPRYQKDLSAVLDFFRELETLPTDDVMPIGHITGRTDVMRSDESEVCSELEVQHIMHNVPETKDGFVKVKSVF